MNTKELDVAIACETYIHIRVSNYSHKCFEGGNL